MYKIEQEFHILSSFMLLMEMNVEDIQLQWNNFN